MTKDFSETATDFNSIRRWYGRLPLEYKYTAGVAGEKFLKLLRDEGAIYGSKCAACEKTFLPPKMYCDNCFEYVERFVRIDEKGYVYSYTSSKSDKIIALIKFKGVSGGLLHKLEGVSTKGVKIGMPVRPVLKAKDKRVGSLTDIEYFMPL